MAEITAVVTQEDTLFAITQEDLLFANTSVANPVVVESMSQIADVDVSSLADGSVLVYKTNVNKWVSTTLLDQQNVEAGEF